MSNVGYDLDTSGGLMPLIRALTKPPDEELSNKSQKKTQHPYYKRPGKGHNHDYCDACEEGGDLICCDRCPASFHLGCHDPPLEEGDIPQGQWLCRECHSAEIDKESSTKSSRATSPTENGDKNSKQRTGRESSSSSKKSDRSDKSKQKDEQNSEAKSPEVQEPEKELSPIELLVKAAKIMNPKQFELPREMQIPCPFPGTDKDTNDAGLVTVDGSGCVPLPAKLCFTCGLNCKTAPLIQCDYCPLLFHQDCLDPPLTALPSGRWMCPNHVEQYIDWKLVNSVSATERVALWDKFTGPVDQHAIKIDFIRQAKKNRPPFRMKVRVSNATGRVCVPPMVKYHYENPPSLLPSRREYIRCKKFLASHPEYKEEPESKTQEKRQICLNIACPMYCTSAGECKHEPWMLEGADEEEKDSDIREVEVGVRKQESEDIEMDTDPNNPPKRRRLSSEFDIKIADEADQDGDPHDFICLKDERGNANAVVEAIDRRLNKLDDRLIRLLAYQRLMQLGNEEGLQTHETNLLSDEAAALITGSIDRNSLRRWGYGRATSFPSRMLPYQERRRIAASVLGRPPRPMSPPRQAARAALSHVRTGIDGLEDGISRPIAIRLSRITIGWADSCDVVLARFGHCQYTSPLHAVIFYDEVSRYFELMNYSEFGTRVNGALYTCELGASEPPVELPTKAVRQLISKKGGSESVNAEKLEDVKWAPVCACPRPSKTPGAWEGAALLQHGAVLHFGCLMFVFSIMDSLARED